MDGDPPELADVSPAAKRVFDALDAADGSLSKGDLATETRHTERTVDAALTELRAEDMIAGAGWPREYRLRPKIRAGGD